MPECFCQKGQIVFAGSSLMEQFPIYEFLQDFDLPYTIYNRGIGGYTTAEMQKVMDVCIYDLAPKAIMNVSVLPTRAFGLWPMHTTQFIWI